MRSLAGSLAGGMLADAILILPHSPIPPTNISKVRGPQKVRKLKSVRVHFAPGKIVITLELLGQFIRFMDQNDRQGLPVLLIY